MNIHHYVTPHFKIKDWDLYRVFPKNCVNEIVKKVIKCAPLITALITIGAIFSLFNETDARYIPYQPVPSTTTTCLPDDVKIVPIAKAIWLFQKKSIIFCGLSNPWCMKGHFL